MGRRRRLRSSKMDEICEICENCGETINQEEYERTGVTEYCESCSDDPRGQTFGHYDPDDE